MTRQLFQYHPIIGYTFIPGINARVNHEAGGYLVRVNRAGFRCEHEFDRKKTDNKFRIIVLGDSFTAADGVSNKFRYTDILEGLLPNVEVYNFALPGSGTDQQYLVFREFAAELEYDLLIISSLVENIRRVASRYRLYVSSSGQTLVMAKPYYSLNDEGNLQLHHCPVPKGPIPQSEITKDQQKFVDRGGNMYAIRKIVNKLGGNTKNFIQMISRYQPLPAYDDQNNSDWLLMKAILKKLIAESKTKTILFPIPLYQHIEGTSSAEGYQARFKELSSPPEIIIHDPLHDLLNYTKKERREFRFKKDIHPTPAFHNALAESLVSIVKSIIC